EPRPRRTRPRGVPAQRGRADRGDPRALEGEPSPRRPLDRGPAPGRPCWGDLCGADGCRRARRAPRRVVRVTDPSSCPALLEARSTRLRRGLSRNRAGGDEHRLLRPRILDGPLERADNGRAAPLPLRLLVPAARQGTGARERRAPPVPAARRPDGRTRAVDAEAL